MPRPDPTPARERTTEAAVRAVRGGAASWTQDHLDAVYRYARRRLPAPDAEDVVQQAFEALYRAQREGRAPEDPAAYLLGTVRRRMADLWRTRARRPQPVALPEGWERYGAEDLPPATLEAAELRDLVQTALGLLPGEEAWLLRARYRRGVSTRAMAETLGLTPKAVEMRLRRARARFLATFRRVGRDWTDADEDPAGEVTA